MQGLLPTTTDGSPKKLPFFKKPGSIAGTILLGLGGAFLLMNLVPILAWLNSLLLNAVTAAGLIIALAALAYVAFDPKVRTIASELYFMAVRKLMGIVVDMDPISIVRHHIEKMKEKICEIEKNMGSLKGLIKESERRLKDKKEKLQHDVMAVEISRGKGNAQDAKVYENSVVRLTGVIERQERRLEDARKWYNILSDLRHAAKCAVLDTENEVNERVEEWEMIKKQHKVFTSVMGIIKGNDKLNTFTMAMDTMSYDITQKLGEMEDIINETGGILSEIGVEDSITSAKATALLEKYDKFGIDGLLNKFDTNNLRQAVEVPYQTAEESAADAAFPKGKPKELESWF